ncbi:hypothetical protein MM188_003224 [Vibrio cholerae]|nr:hypothetical protein [Vibrio cholerae]
MALQGSGTAADPFLVWNAEDLKEMFNRSIKETRGWNIRFMDDIEVREILYSKDNYYSLYDFIFDLNGFVFSSIYGFVLIQDYRFVYRNGIIKPINYTGGTVFYQYWSDLDAAKFQNIQVLCDLPLLSNVVLSRNGSRLNTNTIVNARGGFSDGVTTEAQISVCATKTNAHWKHPGQVNLTTYPAFKSSPDWVENEWYGLTYAYQKAKVLTGGCYLDDTNQPLANREIRVYPVHQTNEQYNAKWVLHGKSKPDGIFNILINEVIENVIVFCFDKVTATLLGNKPYQVGDIAVPEIQNGYKYQCITAGTTGELPSPLPTSGLLQSGTAVFSIEPLIPPVCYGPVTPKRIIQ